MIILKSDFELIEVAGEYMLVPVGDTATSFQGVIALNEASGFLLKRINDCNNIEGLAISLTKEYNIDIDIAKKDIDEWVNRLVEFGVIEVL